ncbi:MAG: hypothetical protein LC808_28500, partial [Actinobacteria bacterium]|nr:hypothetical protein [Actinomycetota bacterium]
MGSAENLSTERVRDPGSSSIRDVVIYCIRVFLSVRVGLFVLGLVAVALLPPNDAPSVPGWHVSPLTPGWHNLFTAWERWDAL